ncbi:Alkbh3, partial [Symbiodinium pilosum]
VFGEEQLVPTVDLSAYQRMGAKVKVQKQEELDAQLRDRGCAALRCHRVDGLIAEVLELARQEFRERMANVDDWGWRGFGCGWVFPRSAEMYSHPHYLAFVREDGSTDPPDAPFRLDRLLAGLQRHILPYLEDVLEHGLNFAPGSLAGALQITTAIAHYYPDATKQETLLTHAAFHCDDSFLTLNLETNRGIHGLQSGPEGPQIRRFRYDDEANSSVINLFVGGYLQSLSQGRWRSLLHSGSNPSDEDRLSLTLFLGIPQLHEAARAQHEGTRGEQEQQVFNWFGAVQHMDEWSAGARFDEIQDMYTHGDGFHESVQHLLNRPRPPPSKTRARHWQAIANARAKLRRAPALTAAATFCAPGLASPTAAQSFSALAAAAAMAALRRRG